MKENPSGRLHGFVGKALLACASFVLTALLVEAALPYLLRLEKVTITYDALLGFRGRPGLSTVWRREMAGDERMVRTNSDGFHDWERSKERSPGTHRVVFLGDSYLEAYQVEIDSNFAQQLGRRLSGSRAGGVIVEALNQGVHGYGLGVHYLYVRERLLQWQPDTVVLVLFLGNDIHDNFAPLASSAVPRFDLDAHGGLVYKPAPPYGLRTWLRDNVLAKSTAMRLIWMHVIKRNAAALNLARTAGMVSTPRVEADSRQALEHMTTVAYRQLREIAAILEAADVGLLVYAIPDPLRVNDLLDIERYRVDSSAPVPVFRTDKEFLETRLLRILEDRGIGTVYSRDEFIKRIAAGQSIYRNGYGHFSQLGHDLSAQLLEAPLAALVREGVSEEVLVPFQNDNRDELQKGDQ